MDYATQYPKGPGRYPLYPDPTGIYTPVGSPVKPMGATDSATYPPAVAKTMAVPPSTPGTPWVLPPMHTSAGQADQDIASRQVSDAQPAFPGVRETGIVSGGSQILRRGNTYSDSVAGLDSIDKQKVLPSVPGFLAGVKEMPNFTGMSRDQLVGMHNAMYGSGNAYPTPPNPVAAQLASVESMLNKYEGDMSFTGRVMYKNLSDRFDKLVAASQQYQKLGIEGGELGVHQTMAQTGRMMVDPAAMHGRAALSSANTAYLHAMGPAMQQQLMLSLLQNPTEGNLDLLRKITSSLGAKPDMLPFTNGIFSGYMPTEAAKAGGGFAVSLPGMTPQITQPQATYPQPKKP